MSTEFAIIATLLVKIGKYIKDRIWVPITKNKIACFALLLSCTTLYYQFLRRSHDFNGLVVDYIQDIGGGRSARVVLINNGNCYETLCDAKLIYSRSKDFSERVYVSGRNVNGPVVLGPGERVVCLVKDQIKAGEVLHRIRGSLKPFQGSIITVLDKFEEEGKLPFRLYYGVLFEVAGSPGRVHKTWCFVGSIEVTKKYPLVFYSNSVNRTCDLLIENFNPKGTIHGMFR